MYIMLFFHEKFSMFFMIDHSGFKGILFQLIPNFIFFFIDTTAPTVSNCPGNMTLNKYTLISHNRPAFADNAGIKSFVVSPRNANTTLVLEESSQTITYTATDFNGNVDSCSFIVDVAGESTLEFNCMNVHFFKNESMFFR